MMGKLCLGTLVPVMASVSGAVSCLDTAITQQEVLFCLCTAIPAYTHPLSSHLCSSAVLRSMLHHRDQACHVQISFSAGVPVL